MRAGQLKSNDSSLIQRRIYARINKQLYNIPHLSTMALMFPACFSSKSPAAGAAGEQLVYNHFRDTLPDNWVVIHDLWRLFFQTKKRYYANYETDFIILIPDKGIMVVEVKNIKTIKVKDGTWTRVGSDGVESDFGSHHSPVHQAYLASKRLRKCLSTRFDTEKMEVRSMAILLQQKRTDIPADSTWDDMLVCGMDELQSNLTERINSLFTFKREFTEEQIQEVRSFLVQTIQYTQDLHTYTNMMDTVAAPLNKTLSMLENCRGGIRVDGCAGTGKTVMALTEAQRLATRAMYQANGQRVLILCFNRHLGESIKNHKLIRKLRQKGHIYANTFAGFCDAVLEPAGICIDWRHANHEVEANTQQLLSEIERNWQFDYVFVDEAQDFNPTWWQFIYKALGTKGKLYLFTDTNQALFGHADTVPDFPTRVTLQHNLRNSKDIATYGRVLLPDGAVVHPLPLSVQEVNILPGAADVEERARMANELLQELLKTYDRRDIAVLSPWKKTEKSSLSRIPGVSGAYPSEPADNSVKRHEAWKLGETVLGESIRAFKGLESLVVILTDVPAPGESPAFSPNDFYVACTRARVVLYIIPTQSGEPYVREVLQRAKEREGAECAVAPYDV